MLDTISGHVRRLMREPNQEKKVELPEITGDYLTICERYADIKIAVLKLEEAINNNLPPDSPDRQKSLAAVREAKLWALAALGIEN